jgi:hypothetical protein
MAKTRIRSFRNKSISFLHPPLPRKVTDDIRNAYMRDILALSNTNETLAQREKFNLESGELTYRRVMDFLGEFYEKVREKVIFFIETLIFWAGTILLAFIIASALCRVDICLGDEKVLGLILGAAFGFFLKVLADLKKP